ncbi:E3 ubiquitin-protein ligase LRSAM1-like [Arctopsyche grandis]|uniref:E3 ubiquitin-protein ligase LRSAM1-like n=1 Tax=Arctopsyche grandis TaxID=121162 RepID=UPI00406D7BE0
MGCSAGGGFSMRAFGWGGSATGEGGRAEVRARLQRKLCLARESPDTQFDLSECELRAVPSGVFSLCRVFRKDALILRDNQLSHLTDGGDLADLILIQILDVSLNRIPKLPDAINRLINLIELHASNNQIKTLPDSIGDLFNLRVLDVSHNCLKSLTPSLGKLGRLKHLNVSHNDNLKTICKELSTAVSLSTIILDAGNFSFPPTEIAQQGTSEIMKFLCKESSVEYIEPVDMVDDASSPFSISPHSPFSPVDYNKSLRSQLTNWEEQDENMTRLEKEIHEAAKRQKEKFLVDYTREQKKLDFEFSKIQLEKDVERSKLIKQIRDEDRFTEEVVVRLLQMNLSNPQHIQQLLEHDEKEHDRLLEMCRTQYTDLKKVDTLKAMESLLQEECEYEKSLKVYGETQSEAKQSFLIQELNANYQMNDLLKTRGELQSNLMETLLNDENMQKAAVGALLEKCDARTWGLVQEISLVESHLAKLSHIELDRRKLELNDNMENLTEQRIKLSMLLVDLLDQQESRRSQLIDTLHAMEMEKKTSSDFWLIRYQQLMEALPSQFVFSQQQLDPILANYLLQEGVIHCLPFLVHWISSKHELATLNDDMLVEQGVRLSNDRANILKAVNLYLEEMEVMHSKLGQSTSVVDDIPSAPAPSEPSISPQTSVDGNPKESSECVVCMEKSCAVVFIPCGHLCCCLKCSDAIEQLCPMCRQDIERKIRVIQS